MKNLSFLIVAGCFLLIGFGCSNNQAGNNPTRNALTSISENSPTSNTKPADTRTIKFPIQGGKEIKAEIVSKNEGGIGIYAARFSPYVERTDGNLYAIALEMLNKTQGKQRGLILLESAKIQKLPSGNFVCWEIANPKQDFCVAPIDVSDKDKRIGAVSFFVK